MENGTLDFKKYLWAFVMKDLPDQADLQWMPNFTFML